MAKGEDVTTRFKVDISDLKKAMQDARKEIALANSSFKAVSSSMDDWSKSSEGIKAKLTQLKSNLSSQKKVLSEYEKALEAVKKEYGENSTQAMEYQTKLNNQQAVVNRTEQEIKKYSQELEKAEEAEKIAAKTGKDAVEVFDELGKEAEDTGTAVDKLKGGFTVFKGVLADLVSNGIRSGVSALKDFATSMVDTAAEVRAERSKFSQTFGDIADDAEAMINRIGDATGIIPTRLNDAGANIYAFARASGASTEEALSLMDTALTAAADSAAYYDTSLEDATDTLMSFLKGNFANDAALGVSATEATRNAEAMELFGVKYNELSEIQKQQTLLAMVTDAQKLSGAMGQASREADGWENVQGNLNETWRQFKAAVGTPFLDALIPVIQDVTTAFKSWADNVDWDAFGEKVKTVTDGVKTGVKWFLDNKNAVLTGLGAILAVIGTFKIASLISSLMALANPVTLVIAGISALVAAFVTLWNKSEEFRNFWINLWDGIKSSFDAVWQGIVTFFTDTIPNAFNGVINWIKSNWTTLLTFLINPFAGLFKYFYENNSKFREFVDNAVNAIKELPSKVWTWLQNTINKLSQFATNLAQKGRDAANGLVNAVVNGIRGIPSQVASIGSDIVRGLWNGINDMTSWVIGKIQGFGDSVLTGLKNFFKIGSPSRLMEDEVGKWLPAGIAVGIDKNARSVMNSLKDVTADSLTGVRSGLNTASINGAGAVGGVVNNFTQINNSPKALSRLELYRQSKNLLGYAGG